MSLPDRVYLPLLTRNRAESGSAGRTASAARGYSAVVRPRRGLEGAMAGDREGTVEPVSGALSHRQWPVPHLWPQRDARRRD